MRCLMDVKKTVAKRIRVARAELGISQSELAEELGLTQNSVSKWESGKVSIGVDTLALIAEALHKPITYFFQEFEQVDVKKEQARRRRAA